MVEDVEVDVEVDVVEDVAMVMTGTSARVAAGVSVGLFAVLDQASWAAGLPVEVRQGGCVFLAALAACEQF